MIKKIKWLLLQYFLCVLKTGKVCNWLMINFPLFNLSEGLQELTLISQRRHVFNSAKILDGFRLGNL